MFKRPVFYLKAARCKSSDLPLGGRSGHIRLEKIDKYKTFSPTALQVYFSDVEAGNGSTKKDENRLARL